VEIAMEEVVIQSAPVAGDDNVIKYLR